MQKQLSLGIAVGIVVLALVVVGTIYWLGSRSASSPMRKPAQSRAGAMPQQTFVPSFKDGAP